jgi:hypothetical protein
MAREAAADWTTVSRSFVVRRRTEVALGDGPPVRIGPATLLAPGVGDRAETFLGGPARDRASRLVTAPLAAALDGVGMTAGQTIRLAGSGVKRGGRAAGAMEVVLPDPGPDQGQLVMAVDPMGVVSWHLSNATESASMRGTRGESVRRYTVPHTAPDQAPAQGAVRGMISEIGEVVLKELVFPLLDPVIGQIGNAAVHRFETLKTPYRMRTFGVDDYAVGEAPSCGDDDWSRLASGRALLMVHGTFSRSHLAFGALPSEFVAELNRLYGGRVFAFDHFTLSHDPSENVRRLLEMVPEGTSLDLDIVCHSRGGLVSRVLSEQQGAFSLGRRSLHVGRVVFVGVPNAGTPLADPGHLQEALDTFTNLLNFVPGPGLTDAMALVLTVLKQLAVGAFGGLEGLRSMHPGGEFLRELNAGQPTGGTRYHAVAADVTPVDPGIRHWVVSRGINRLLAGPNDFIVPEHGVHAANGGAGFPVADPLLLTGDEAVAHTRYFAQARVREQILAWLGAEA